LSSTTGSTTSPSPGLRHRVPSSTSGDGFPSTFRSPGMIFSGSVNPFSTDALRGSSTQLYALRAHLQLPAKRPRLRHCRRCFLVIIRSVDLDVTSSSMEDVLVI
jgi:hypothetical protein